MHTVKFDHRLDPQLDREKPVLGHRANSVAASRLGLYGHRRHFLQVGLQIGFALGVFMALFPDRLSAARPLKLIAFGDSLTAGYKLPADEAFPAVLEKALRAEGMDVTVVNAGVSGDTSADGLARLDWTFADSADGAIVELGANDMLRGIDPELTRQTLDTIFSKLRERKIHFLIAGMLATPSLGASYQQAFNGIYGDLAHKYDAPLYPFFLEGVMNNRTLQLPDGLHPNREGVEHIVHNMLPSIETFIKSLLSRS